MEHKTIINNVINKAKNKTKSVLILLIVCLLLGILSVVAQWWFGNQAIKSISISGNNVITTNEIYTTLDKYIINIPNNNLDLNLVKIKLLENEYIANANVFINSKGVLGIQIEERKPIAIIINNYGNTMLVDQYGHIFNWRPFNEFNDFPIISNVWDNNNLNKNNAAINNIALNSALEIIKEIDNNFPTINKILSEINFVKKDRTFQLFLNEANICINFGKPESINNKLNNIALFWNKVILPSNNFSKFAKIDARWNNKNWIVVSN